jgi:hypothetical protein
MPKPSTRLRSAGFRDPGTHQHPRIRHERARPSPLSTGATCNPWNLAIQRRRLQWRSRRSRGKRHPAGHPCHRQRRVDPYTGFLQRAGGTQADTRPAGVRARTGATPRTGISHEHAVTRSVRDCAAILDATAGPDVGAPYFTQKPARLLPGKPSAHARSAACGWLSRTTHLRRPAVTMQSASAAVEKRPACWQGLGHRVEERAPRSSTTPTLAGRHDDVLLLTGLAAIGCDAREAQFGRSCRRGRTRARHARCCRIRTHGQRCMRLRSAASGVINREVRRIAQFFETTDMFLTPTLSAPP